MVLEGSSSFRGVNRNLALCFSSFGFDFPVPSFSSVRLWIQRIGYYKLVSPKEIAEDWAWILDHTIQQDSTKILLIMGIRLKNLPQVGEPLSLGDMKPLELFPVKQSNGEIVYEQLNEIIEKTGVPRCILSDAGSDLKKGIELFCEDHPQTEFIYDITHKCACILKRALGKDEVWLEFCSQVASTRQALQQTNLSHFLPPVFKTKARYMNLDEIVIWGNRMIAGKEALSHPLDSNEREKFQEKLGWIDEFKEPIEEWREMIAVIGTTEEYVRKRGVFLQSDAFLQRMPKMNPSTPKALEVKKELLEFIQLQSLKAQIKERLPGSSEVIESVFGKFKRIEKDQTKNGFTSMVLAIPAMLAKTTKEVVAQAMKEVPTKKTIAWAKETLGKTTNSKKRDFHDKADQSIKIQALNAKVVGTKVGSVMDLVTR